MDLGAFIAGMSLVLIGSPAMEATETTVAMASFWIIGGVVAWSGRASAVVDDAGVTIRNPFSREVLVRWADITEVDIGQRWGIRPCGRLRGRNGEVWWINALPVENAKIGSISSAEEDIRILQRKSPPGPDPRNPTTDNDAGRASGRWTRR
jgi:hypothetical protein